jgi:glycosyltransferase involved in cell wall biosynthesis
MLISVIIPCYNEQDRIPKTLARIHEHLSQKPYEFEVLVVDNGSKDNTRKIVEKLTKDIPEIRLVPHRSYGKGWAVKQGMLEAQGDYRLFTDADNSTDIAHLDTMLPYMEQEYDVVISSRRMEGAVIMHPQPFYRRILGDLFAKLVKTLVPLGINDTQNGFKLFSRKAAEDIFPRQSTYFWAFDIELLGLAKKRGHQIKEIPITWVNDDQSKMSLQGMLRMLVEVVNIRLLLSSKK